jgi:hypothetical protein
MTRTKNNKSARQSGFAVEITDSTNLGLAMLIAESEDGHYEPVAVVGTLSEAREIARDDRAQRMRALERGGEPLCPHAYKVWARGTDGEYQLAFEIADAVAVGRYKR